MRSMHTNGLLCGCVSRVRHTAGTWGGRGSRSATWEEHPNSTGQGTLFQLLLVPTRQGWAARSGATGTHSLVLGGTAKSHTTPLQMLIYSCSWGNGIISTGLLTEFCPVEGSQRPVSTGHARERHEDWDREKTVLFLGSANQGPQPKGQNTD